MAKKIKKEDISDLFTLSKQHKKRVSNVKTKSKSRAGGIDSSIFGSAGWDKHINKQKEAEQRKKNREKFIKKQINDRKYDHFVRGKYTNERTSVEEQIKDGRCVENNKID